MLGVELRPFRWDSKMVRGWTRYSDRMRESPYHESDLKIEEHYTDSAGFTDHVFARSHLLTKGPRPYPVPRNRLAPVLSLAQSIPCAAREWVGAVIRMARGIVAPGET